jgi:hypothetical protein
MKQTKGMDMMGGEVGTSARKIRNTAHVGSSDDAALEESPDSDARKLAKHLPFFRKSNHSQL